jgi:hypothetical protein
VIRLHVSFMIAVALGLAWFFGGPMAYGYLWGSAFGAMTLFLNARYVSDLLRGQKMVAWVGGAIVMKYPLFGILTWFLIKYFPVSPTGIGLGLASIVLSALFLVLQKRMTSKDPKK